MAVVIIGQAVRDGGRGGDIKNKKIEKTRKRKVRGEITEERGRKKRCSSHNVWNSFPIPFLTIPD